MRRGQHNSGLTGGPINGTKLPEVMVEVIVAPTVVELMPPPVEPEPVEEGARVVKPVKPKIRPKGK